MPEPINSQPSPALSPFQWRTLAQSGWLYPLLACLLLVILFSAKGIGSYDLGMHLAGGQWIVQHRAFPIKDTFTYTQSNQDYLDSHWLYQIILYLMEIIFGYSGLLFLHMAMVLLTFSLLFWRIRLTQAPAWLACFLLLASILMIERRFTVRPEVFSWFFLSLTLLVLELRAGKRNLLLLLPVIQFFWVNTEGLFMLGWLAMAAYVLSGRYHQKKWDTPLLKFSFLSMAAGLLNPYFLKGLAFPLVLLTRFQQGNLFKQTISEFSSPWQYWQAQKTHHDLSLPIILMFLLACLGAFLVLATLKRRNFHELILGSAFGWLGFSMVRNIPLFTLVLVPLIASCWPDLSVPERWKRLRGKAFPILTTLLILSIALRVVTNAYYVDDRRLDRFGIGLDQSRLPVKAVDFLRNHGLNGRLVNNLSFGGWLDWKGSQPAFIDGRLEVMENSFYENYILSFRENGLAALLIQYQPQLILADYNSAPSWIEQLRSIPNWRLIFLDECSAVYAHGDYAKDLPSLDFNALLTGRNIPRETDGAAVQDLERFKPNRLKTWLEGFYLPQNYSLGHSSLGLFCLRAGETQAARDLFVEGLRRSGGGYEEIYFNVGIAYLRLRQMHLGKAFLQQSLELNPKNPATLQMLGQLQGF